MKGKIGYGVYKIKLLTVAAVSLTLGLLLIWCREAATAGAVEGLTLCGRVIIPSLFPFMALSGFVSRSGVGALLGRVISPVAKILFGVKDSEGALVLLSFVGGYPLSAKLLEDMHKRGEISAERAVRLLNFTVNPGPAFLVLAVGGVILSSPKAGWLLLASVALASVTVGVLQKKSLGADVSFRREKIPVVSFSQAFCDSCSDAASAVITICAFSVLFSSAASVFSSLPIPLGVVRLVLPILEITSGIASAGHMPLPLYAAWLSFGGLAVAFQIKHYASAFAASMKEILWGRIQCAFFSFIFSSVLFYIFPVEPEFVFTSAAFSAGRGSAASSVMLIISLGVFLIYIGQQNHIKNLQESDI